MDYKLKENTKALINNSEEMLTSMGRIKKIIEE